MKTIKRKNNNYKIKRRCKCLGKDKMFGMKTYLCDDDREYYFTNYGLPVVIGVRKG